MRAFWLQAVLVCSIVGTAGLCMADPVITGPVFPPPGDVDYAFSGAGMGEYDGLTISYSNLDPSQYDQLWWGISGLAPLGISLDDGVVQSSELLGPGSGSGSLIRYSGEAVFQRYFNGNLVTETLDTRMLIRAKDSSGNYLTAIAAPSGMNDARDYVFEVPGSNHDTGFSVNIQAQANVYRLGSYNYEPIDVFFDYFDTPTGNSTKVTASGGFWSTPEPIVDPIPEPSTLAALISMGLMGLAIAWRRRKRAA